MKLLVFTFVVCFTAVLAAPADKQKRDILPGDPRYGTEHHHHQEHENEVQISKAAGGYVGSFAVPGEEDTEDHSFQVQSQSTYGPPNHAPGKPLGTDFFASGDADKTPASLLVPSTSYGIPDTTQLFNNNYLGPVIEKQSAVIKSSVLDLNTDYQAPSVEAPVSSYDITKTTIQEQPTFDAVNVKSTVSEVHQQPAVVHKHVENVPQAKVTQTQGAVQSSIPSFTSSIGGFPSFLSYSSYANIPVKTVDRHVQVQVPHPYHVPVTKHVAVPVPVPHAVEVPKPYYVRVPQPVQVTVNRPYPVEVPRPVAYPVPHYVKTSVPVAAHQQHVLVDTKASPFQPFFDNTQTTFQNVLAAVPSFPNPLGFQNPLENIDLSSFPPLSFIPQFPIPQIPTPAPPALPDVNVFSSINTDSVTVDNPALKTETKPVQPIKHTQTGFKPSTTCAGCSITSASSKKEYVQPTDANGGYVY